MDNTENSIESPLNRNTSHAPSSKEEVQERLSLARWDTESKSSTGLPHRPLNATDSWAIDEIPVENNTLIATDTDPVLVDQEIQKPPQSATRPGEVTSPEIHEKFGACLSSARELTSLLEKMYATGTDDDRDVEAVVNGLGELADLRISGSASKRAHRLSQSIMAAISRAKAAAEEFEVPMGADFMTHSDLDEIRAAMNTRPARADFSLLDAREAIESRDVIAQAMELQSKLYEASEALKRQELAEEIGVGAGKVSLRLDGSELNIEVPQHILRNISPQRLAGQVLEAVKSIEQRASAHRLSSFDSIIVDGLRLGDTLRNLDRIVTIEQATEE